MTSLDILAMVVAAATAKPDTTAAGERVYGPGDWPAQADGYPFFKLRVSSEDRTSLGRGGPPEFTTLATIQVFGEVSTAAQAQDAGATVAENELWALKRQFEVAVINSYPLTASVQQIASMRTRLGFDSSGDTHLGSMLTELVIEFYEGPEEFAPVEVEDFETAEVTATHYPPAGVAVDLPQ